MSSLMFVNATDLGSWANKRNSQDQLPRLLRRVIRATTEQIQFISVRADEGIHLEGFDGILDVQAGNEFVPSGKSVWEFGTDKKIKAKADKEYENRRDNPRGVVPSDTAFIFVTPRRWRKKADWMKARQAEGFWREVRVYDADDVETWLESAPAVHVWLSILLGKHPETAIDIENFWAGWTEVTQPHLSADLLISGREETVKGLHEWFGQPVSSVSLRLESRSEAIAFLAASIRRLPTGHRERVFSRCLVVEDISAWRQLIACDEALILVPNFSDRETVARAVQGGHRVLIPLGKSDAELADTINVPRLHRANAKEALLAMGTPEEQAEDLATLARRSFLALRRKLAINASVHTPTWATPIHARALLPVLLAGGWNDTNEKDRSAIARLVQASYESINEAAVRWANEPDPPVRRVGNTWLITSKEDSWSLIARYLTRQDLENFETVVLEVLGQIGATPDVSPAERWRAALLPKDVSHSGLLTEGIAESLAIMSARSEVTHWSDSMSGQDRADRIARELFRRANENWHLWATLAYQLPLLAEASPIVFLEAVDAGLSGDSPLLINMFSEGDTLLTSSSPHTGLLWALERLAWHPDYLPHSALLLAKLTRLDPGGKLVNRPIRSLREIFLPWHPQTMATLDQRLEVIDAIRGKESEVAWRFMYSLLPESYSIGHPTPSPRWREWVSEPRPRPTYAELGRSTCEIVSRLLTDVGVDAVKWSELIVRVSELPEGEQNAILGRLSTLDAGEFSSDDRLKVWNTIRQTVSRHREYQTADWAMPIELSDQLERIYNRFTPEDIVSRKAWIFSHHASLIKPVAYDEREFDTYHENKQARMKEERLQAVEEMFRAGGLEMILEATKRVDEPAQFGLTFGTIELVSSAENDLLLQHLNSVESPIALFVRGFVVGRFHTNGWSWAVDKLAIENTQRWSPEQCGEFLSCLPFSGQTWDFVDKLGEATRKAYWIHVNPSYPENYDAERAVRTLLQYRRPQSTIEFLGFLTRRKELVVPATLIVEVLMQLLSVSSESQINWNDLGYNVKHLIGLLDNSTEIEETQIARLEWAYMPILENYGRGPTILHRELSRNPDFFVEVVSYVYRAEDEEPKAMTEASRTRGKLSYKLLNSWRGCPGKGEDGVFDADAMRDWIIQARQKLHDLKRAAIGDQNIGHVLAFAPFGSDGAYPHEAVRALIEELDSRQIERGIEVQIFNNRGVTTRAIAEGGAQERQIAERYRNYSRTVGGRYPRTSAMLRRIAENYDGDAKREDLSAELEEDLWR
ncbi:MAG: hypothetical protein AABM67_21450 [Acidobacteriota bacterium]